jgi:hypothetical protein
VLVWERTRGSRGEMELLCLGYLGMADDEIVWVCEGEALCSQGKMTSPRGKRGGLGREREILMGKRDGRVCGDGKSTTWGATTSFW